MFNGQGRQEVVPRRFLGQLPTSVDMVAQLADQDGRRTFGIVANTPANPADVEPLTSRKQGFKKQVVIVLSSRTVPRAHFLGHEVEVDRWPGSGEFPITHP